MKISLSIHSKVVESSIFLYRTCKNFRKKYVIPFETSSAEYLQSLLFVANSRYRNAGLKHLALFLIFNPLSATSFLKALKYIDTWALSELMAHAELNRFLIEPVLFFEACRKILIFKCRYRAALHLKTHILSLRNTKAYRDNIYSFSNSIEYSDILYVGKHSRDISTYVNPHIYREQTKDLLNIYHSIPDSFADNEYRTYICSKSVAIVGPSSSLGAYGQEIDTYDVIIRINHSDQLHHDKKRGGSRTSVSYFNGVHPVCLREENTIVEDSLEWAVFKSAGDHTGLTNNGCKIRVLAFTYKSEFSEFNLVPLIVSDVLRFRPSCIKIFGVDLYLSQYSPSSYMPQSYYTLNPKARRLNPQDRTFTIERGFLQHDPASQYLFLQRIHRSQLITGDERFSNIMNMGICEYMTQLESNYADK